MFKSETSDRVIFVNHFQLIFQEQSNKGRPDGTKSEKSPTSTSEVNFFFASIPKIRFPTFALHNFNVLNYSVT